MEARVILASVARRYDFVKVGAGEVRLDERGEPVLNEKGQYEVKSELFNVSHIRMPFTVRDDGLTNSR